MILKNKLFFGFLGLISIAQFIPFPTQAQTNIESQQTIACRQELARDIETIINRPQFQKAHWGIAIQNLATKNDIYELNSDKLFIPASTVKLLTTAVALNELGANFRIATPIYATGELPDLETIRVQGRGDPTITSEILKNIVQQFKVLKIDSIKKLIIDDSYFSEPVINPTWEWADTYYYYATAVNSIILNENTVSLTLSPSKIGQPVQLQWDDKIAANQWQVFNQGITALPNTEYAVEIDGVLGKPVLNIRGELPQDNREDVWDMAIVDPANYFLETLELLLTTEGININQGIVVTSENSDLEERIITQMYSPPLQELIKEINRESNNLYAEVILKILAKELNSDRIEEALEIGLAKLNINADTYSIVDGSGLSRQNLITPNTLIDILTVMANSSSKDIYQESLSVAGNNGTLRNRFKNTLLQDNLLAKTGSLSGVITLAGYLQLPNQETVTIGILINNFDRKNRIARQAIDEILLLLPQFQNCL